MFVAFVEGDVVLLYNFENDIHVIIRMMSFPTKWIFFNFHVFLEPPKRFDFAVYLIVYGNCFIARNKPISCKKIVSFYFMIRFMKEEIICCQFQQGYTLIS